MFKPLLHIVMMIVLIYVNGVYAKVRGESKLDGFHSKILAEQRDLLIQLPNNYQQNKALNYPVLYLLDGLRNFNHASGTLDLLNQSNKAQEMIIVAIKNTHRARDFTPTYDESYNQWGISGGADNFLDFIETELIPYINKEYRTNGFNVLSGHSLGGLLAIHSLQTRPNLFQAHFAFSPSLWWHDGVIFNRAKRFYTETAELNSYLYMNLANEGGQMLSSYEQYKQLLQQNTAKGFSYNTDLVKGENHSTSAMVGHNKAYTYLYGKFQCPDDVIAQGLPAIEQYYSKISKTYGAEIKASYHTLAQVAGIAFNNENFAKAIKTYESTISSYPHLSDPYYRLAYIFDAIGEYKKAIQSIEKALKVSINENVENNKYKSFHAHILSKINQGDPALP